AALYVGGHKLVLPLLEHLQFGIIVTLNPTGLVKAGRLPATQSVILMFQPVLYHFKLKLSHRSYQFATVELVNKHLRHTLAHKLVNTLSQLFGTHRIGILNIFEHLRRETGQTLEMEFLALRKGIAYFEVAGVGQPYYVA